MKTLLERTAALALIALGAVACSSSSAPNNITDSGPSGTDVVTGTDAGNNTDTGNNNTDTGNNTGTDTAPAGHDAGPATSVTMAQLANVSSTGHPASGTVVSLSDTNLVALTPRFASGPSSTGYCEYSAWVGTSTGGSYSAMELFEEVHDTTLADGGAGDCYDITGIIPQNLAVGDTISDLQGTFDPYCATGTACPAYASLQLEVESSKGGALTDSGHGGTVPTPATVTIADVTGTGATAGSMDETLQNTLVTITGNIMTVAPTSGTTGNHEVMTVAATGTTTPLMYVVVDYYSGDTCQRTLLDAASTGYTVGSVTGVLEFDFGQWEIQPRNAADLPGVVCPADGGTGTDAATTGTDAASSGG